ncbi:MAG: 6-hydroxymethylpterin diphosphokinase MptE-like protein [bacterium]
MDKDNQLYGNNLKLLRYIEPELARQVENIQPSGEIEVIPARQGLPTLKIGNNFLHSRYDPLKEAGRFIQAYDLSSASLIAVFGLGLGYHVLAMVRHLKPGKKLLILEKDFGILKTALQLIDLRQILQWKGLKLIVTPDLAETKDEISGWLDIVQLTNILTIEHPPSILLSPAYYHQAKEILYAVVSERLRDTLTRMVLENLWMENILKNITPILSCPGVSALFGAFEGIPIFIISAGPSLAKNMEELKAAKGKGVLMAVDTALKPLLSREIIPDIVLSIDAQPESFKDFEGVAGEDITLIADCIAYPEVIKNFKGPIMFSSTAKAEGKEKEGLTFVINPLVSWLEERIGSRGHLQSGGSVATSAFDLARLLGGNPIIFVGQDLAFTGERMYVDGVAYVEERIKKHRGRLDESTLKEEYVEEILRKRRKNLIKVPAIGGGEVLTDRMTLYAYLKWLEEGIPKVKARCIDATEGGALIRGTEVMTLKEAIAQYCAQPQPINRILEEVRSVYQVPDRKNLATAMTGVINTLSYLEHICQQGIELTYRLSHDPSPKVIASLEDIDRQIKEKGAEVAFVGTAIQGITLSIARALAQGKVKDKQAVMARSLALYQGILESSQYMRHLFLEAREELSPFYP